MGGGASVGLQRDDEEASAQVKIGRVGAVEVMWKQKS